MILWSKIFFFEMIRFGANAVDAWEFVKSTSQSSALLRLRAAHYVTFRTCILKSEFRPTRRNCFFRVFSSNGWIFCHDNCNYYLFFRAEELPNIFARFQVEPQTFVIIRIKNRDCWKTFGLWYFWLKQVCCHKICIVIAFIF